MQLAHNLITAGCNKIRARQLLSKARAKRSKCVGGANLIYWQVGLVRVWQLLGQAPVSVAAIGNS